MKPLTTLPRADEEFRQALRYFAQISEGLREQFTLAVDSAFQTIQQNPYTYADENGDGYRFCPTRRFPYTIVYRNLPDRVLVVAISHNGRRPYYWLDQLNEEENQTEE